MAAGTGEKRSPFAISLTFAATDPLGAMLSTMTCVVEGAAHAPSVAGTFEPPKGAAGPVFVNAKSVAPEVARTAEARSAEGDGPKQRSDVRSTGAAAPIVVKSEAQLPEYARKPARLPATNGTETVYVPGLVVAGSSGSVRTSPGDTFVHVTAWRTASRAWMAVTMAIPVADDAALPLASVCALSTTTPFASWKITFTPFSRVPETVTAIAAVAA